MRSALDDLFTADLKANTKTTDQLKGWFKSKTGVGDAVAQKMASTFKALAQYADFDGPSEQKPAPAPDAPAVEAQDSGRDKILDVPALNNSGRGAFGLVYRFEIHLPDTQNVDTYRAIFKALREELM